MIHLPHPTRPILSLKKLTAYLLALLPILLAGCLIDTPPPTPNPTPASTISTAKIVTPSPVPSILPTSTISPTLAAQVAVTVTATATALTHISQSSLTPLAGRRIALDPGHGPRQDLGAVLVDSNTGKLILSEAELNLDLALRTRDLLVARGATVTLTRETPDHFTQNWPPDTNGDGIERNQYDDLQERVDIINTSHAEVFMSIHANSASDPSRRVGIQALYCATTDCAFPAQNKRLGRLVLDHLDTQLNAAGYPPRRSELRDDLWPDYPGGPDTHLFMLGPANPPRHVRSVQMPGILIEAFYVTSPTEAAYLKQAHVRQSIAQAYTDALQEYLTTPGK